MTPNAAADADALLVALRRVGDPARAEQEKRYLKSELAFYGAGVPAIRRVVQTHLRTHPAPTRTATVAIARALWKQPIHEARVAAIEILVRRAALLETADLALVERMLREAKTWAYVDPLAEAVAGSIVVAEPRAVATLDRWARDDDFWVRRASMLALLRPIRRGGGDFERFGRYADGMLDETEFFIRKAIGWVLRETSKKRPGIVYDWLAPRAARASGVTVREAVKYLPARQRAAILASYAGRVGLSSSRRRTSGIRRPAR